MLLLGVQPGWAVLNPEEVLVIANKNAARSVGLARYYMQKRGIPKENLLQVWTTDQERCSREEFDNEIAAPVRRFVTDARPDRAIRCLVLMYGVPFKVSNYVDAFEWRPGAVGYHIASSECATLKGKSQVWCKRMLEEGVAATFGPVGEPYVQAFPLPEIFFKTLLDGDFSLAECYLLSIPSWSWKMVLIGDQLYRPFKNQQP